MSNFEDENKSHDEEKDEDDNNEEEKEDGDDKEEQEMIVKLKLVKNMQVSKTNMLS